MTLDALQQSLHEAGWSTGDTATPENGQLTWLVYCHRGDHKLVAKGASRLEAWQAVVKMAAELGPAV
jgi:hypothetical protein